MMAETTVEWHKVAASINEITWGPNYMALVTTGNRKFTLVRKNEDLFACASTCPHAGFNLSEGYLDGGGNIVCPLHGYKFSLANGRNITGEGYHLKTYPVEVRPSGIFVGVMV